jgi:hypothetical protein
VAPALEPVSASVTGLESLGEPVPGFTDDYLEIADPPADVSDCPAPDPTVVSGRFFQGLAGTGPTIVNGP